LEQELAAINKLLATLMQRLSAIILLLLATNCYGQCEREYPSGFYHYTGFILPTGDTICNLDPSGLYHGLHIYSDNEKYLINNTTSYLQGYFQHGLPVREWIDHCKDGTFSVGQFNPGGGEVSSDEKGGWIEKKQGIYNKIGVWRFYSKDSQLQKTIRFDRTLQHRGWTDKIYFKDSSGDFVLTKYFFNSRHSLKSPFKKRVTKEFINNGTLTSMDFESFWKDISILYYENGQIKEREKCRKFLGIKINRSIAKTYSEDGKLINKTRGKCWTKIVDHAW
jgi:hypothetical protein